MDNCSCPCRPTKNSGPAVQKPKCSLFLCLFIGLLSCPWKQRTGKKQQADQGVILWSGLNAPVVKSILLPTSLCSVTINVIIASWKFKNFLSFATSQCTQVLRFQWLKGSKICFINVLLLKHSSLCCKNKHFPHTAFIRTIHKHFLSFPN